MMIVRIVSIVGIILLVGCRFAENARVVPRAHRVDHSTDIATRLPAIQGEVQAIAYSPADEFIPPPPENIAPADPCPPSSPWDAELSLQQLEEFALGYNPSLAEAQARVEAARGKWVQVGLPPNTVLGYSGQQLGSHGEAEQQGVFVGQEFVRGGKLRLNRAIVDQEILQAEQLWFAQQQRVLTDVRLGYYEVLIAQRRIEVAQQLVEIADKALETAEALLKAEEVSRVDVLRSRGAQQVAQLLHKNAGVQHRAAWSRLVAVLGSPDQAPRRLLGSLNELAEPLDEQQVLQRLLVESPEVAAAAAGVERAQWSLERAYAEPVPNVDVQAIAQSDNGTGSTNGNLQISMPIPWLNRNQGGIREAAANLVEAEHALARVQLGLQHRLASAFQRYASARNQVEDYARPGGILENVQATLDFVQRAYQGGELAYLDLLTAQTTYSETQLGYLEALGELWAATVEIEGLLLKDSLTGSMAWAAD